jgi:hypothetical protein
MSPTTRAALLDQLVALHAEHGEAHRRMVDALHSDNLLALVEASRQQAAICTQQGDLLADYVAATVTAMPDIDAGYREQVRALAQQLRGEQTKTAGG